MKKNLISGLLLSVTILISVYSCRNNDLAENENPTYSNSNAFRLTSKRISLNEAKHKTKLLPALEKAEVEIGAKLKGKQNVSGKVVDFGNGVSIDTDNVIYIENGPDYYTYTFNISREETSENTPVENLVLSPLSDGTWKEVLISYDLTEQEKKTLNAGGAVDMVGKISYTRLENGTYSSGIMNRFSEECHMEIDSYYTWCSEGIHHNGELSTENGGSCNAETQSVLMITADIVCPSDGGSTGQTYPEGSGSGSSAPGGSSGTGSNTPCGGSTIPSQPESPNATLGNGNCPSGTLTLPNISSFFSFVRNLDLNFRTLIPSGTPLYNAFQTYYDAGNGSSKATAFITWGLTYLSANPNAYNYFSQYPSELSILYSDDMDFTNPDDADFANAAANVLTDFMIANKGNTLDQGFLGLPSLQKLKQEIDKAIAKGWKEFVRRGTYYYGMLKKLTDLYPNATQWSVAKVNTYLVDPLRAYAASKNQITYKETDPSKTDKMLWKDILLCWFFELGDFPTYSNGLPWLGFKGKDYVISGIPNSTYGSYLLNHKRISSNTFDENSVLELRDRAIKQIKTGDLNPLTEQWHFGSAAAADTVFNLDGLQFCLGSYFTTVNITHLSGNTYRLNFSITNKTGWESGTRGSGINIIDDKPRGTGINLGGTLFETFGWYEDVVVN